MTPRDIGEEQLPFFMAMRSKLYFKCLQDLRNSNRFTRKPMPQEIKKEYAQKAKEFYAYKLAEKSILQAEANEIFKSQTKAFESVLFLPDYLMEEALEETGESRSGDMEEFQPAKMYTEQILRIFPREFSARFRVNPAFEETLMKIDEARGGSGRQSSGASSGGGAMPAPM